MQCALKTGQSCQDKHIDGLCPAGQTGCKAGGFRAGAGAAVALLSSPSSR